MNASPPLPKHRRKLLVAVVAVVVATFVVIYRGHVGCYLFFAECNPLLSVPEMPGWNVPTNPVEKAGYDFAHALKLPEGVPQPVPFDFKAARIKAIEANVLPFEIHQHVAQQYFDHLCSTEAGVTVFDTAENVDGVLMLRSERRGVSKPWTHDRYGTEDAVSQGNYMADEDFYGGYYGTPVDMIQPHRGRYAFIEYPASGLSGSFFRFVRKLNSEPPDGYGNGVMGTPLPLMVVRTVVPESIAKYAITWRGLRRPRDREFAIAGSEMIVLEVGSKRVLAVNRDFLLSGRDIRPSGVWWSNAQSCRHTKNTALGFNAYDLANLVLKPVASVNDEATLPAALKF